MNSRLKDLYRKAKSYLRMKVIDPEMLGGLLFGQQHVFTQSFFTDRLGQYHTVPLEEFPHYLFLRDSLEDPFSDNVYLQYLECSWNYYYGKENNTTDRRTKKVQDFLDLYYDIESKRDLGIKAIKVPITVSRRPDGKVIIVEGNHRAAVALKLGLGIRALFIPASEYISRVVNLSKQYFGAGRLNRPYQSVFHQGKLLVEGRRPDIYERMQLIAVEHLKEQTVLDLGCNIGMNCYLAAEYGALNARGVDVSSEIISSAVRLNSYFASPCEFSIDDLNKALDLGRFDTTFCFSVTNHLKNIDGIVNTIRKCTKNVLYFEGHANTSQSDYRYLLNEDIFSKIELIGYSRDEFRKKSASRPLFRAFIRH